MEKFQEILRSSFFYNFLDLIQVLIVTSPSQESTAANANSVATTSTDVNIVGIASSEISKVSSYVLDLNHS